MKASRALRVAVLIPCFNESIAIGGVVKAFRAQLPDARIYVYDNNSTDETAEVARQAGARVRFEGMRGKGNVVRRMFADVDADVCVLVDGDMTYDASAAPAMIRRLLDDSLYMVVASRVSNHHAAYRQGHELGNRILTRLASLIFGAGTFTDMLSGYRVFSRRFVKSFPAHAQGFETEVELAVHAMELHMPVAEMPSQYFARPEGSQSKLNTYGDGWRILKTIVRLFKNGRPLTFFSMLCALCLVFAVLLAAPLLTTYLATGLVPRFPTAILSAAVGLLAGIFLVCGLVLDTVTLGRREGKYASYLSYPPVNGWDE